MHIVAMQNHSMQWQIFQHEKPLVNLSNVTAKATFVKACPIKVPQELMMIRMCIRSSHSGETYPVAYSIVIIRSLAVSTTCMYYGQHENIRVEG